MLDLLIDRMLEKFLVDDEQQKREREHEARKAHKDYLELYKEPLSEWEKKRGY